MIGVPVAPRRVFGVTLAAGSDAGARTWVCRAHPGPEGIRVENVSALVDLPGGGLASDAACRSLVTRILEAPRSAWGFDFAFGLPLESLPADGGLAPGLDAWKQSVASLAEAPPSLPPTDARRRTDIDHGRSGPLEAENAATSRLGIVGILRPVHGQPGVAILPIDPLPLLTPEMPPAMRARAASTYLLEVDAGLLLERLAEDPPHDSGGTGAPQSVSRALVAAGWVRPLPRALRQLLDAEPAALAAVACAVAAWRGYRKHDHGALCRTAAYGAEGHVYL